MYVVIGSDYTLHTVAVIEVRVTECRQSKSDEMKNSFMDIVGKR